MTEIGIKRRLVKAGLPKDKSIGSTIDGELETPGVFVTYSRDELSLDSISEIAPLARRKPDSIAQAVDYMLEVRKKPRDENIIVTLAKPKRIVSTTSDSVESLVVKGVSMPLKSYSCTGIARLASGFIGGLDVLMSQSLSIVFGLFINVSMAYFNYRKKGSSLEYFMNLIMLLAIEAILTLLIVFGIGIFTDFNYIAISAIASTGFFFIVNFLFKSFQKHKDRLTALAIDREIDSEIFQSSKAKIDLN